jgi:hypothetical protein
MKAWNDRTLAPPPRDVVLPRSIGVLITATAALICWAGLIAIAARALS